MSLFAIYKNLGGSSSTSDQSWISTGTVIKASLLLLASSVFLFGVGSAIRPVAPIIVEILDEEPNEVRNGEHLDVLRDRECLLTPLNSITTESTDSTESDPDEEVSPSLLYRGD